MVRKFCDICGEEIHETGPMANAYNMMLRTYRVQRYERTLGMALPLVDVDLCDGCGVQLEITIEKMKIKAREAKQNAAAGADGHSGRGEDSALL